MSTATSFRGRAWLLGENIDTDAIAPGKYIQLGAKDIAKHTLSAIRPDLAPNFRPGDLIVAGRNFGCGSSREQAPRALRELGVAVIVAPSFARIFYRNCLAIGQPVAIVDGATDFVAEQDEVAVDLDAAELRHPASGRTVRLRRTPPEVVALFEKGGIEPLIREIARQQRESRRGQ
jgi:3-isopropylmalate/(R)-2-methylmalate dehydratase small subunit